MATHLLYRNSGPIAGGGASSINVMVSLTPEEASTLKAYSNQDNVPLNQVFRAALEATLDIKNTLSLTFSSTSCPFDAYNEQAAKENSAAYVAGVLSNLS